MAIRKSNDLENESDSRYNNVKTSKAREKITERFDDTVTGWTMNIDFKQPLQYDECAIPD